MKIRRLNDGDFLLEIECNLRNVADRKLYVSVGKDGVPLHPEHLPILVKIGRAERMLELLASGKFMSREKLAQHLGMSNSSVSKILPTAFLSPTIVQMAVEGKLVNSRLSLLLERLPNLPLWADQHRFLGID